MIWNVPIDGNQDRVGAKATVRDVAREAGVSKSTVSLVLQNSPLVRDDTRARVTEAIQHVGYIYNRGAAGLRRARSNVVGMIINDLTNSFFAELAVGIERILQAAGYIPFIANTAESALRQQEVVMSMREHGAAGLIICPARGTARDAFAGCVEAGVPVVLAVRRLATSPQTATVVPDNRRGANEAVAHLLGLGHRRVAFLGGYPDIVAQHDRIAGYREALQQAAVPVDETLVITTSATREGGVSALESALRMPQPPTAALCFNDAVALGACAALKRRQLEPGADFAIVGFDDVSDARYAVPALTTVAVDPVGLGERAAQAVVRMIETGKRTAETLLGAVQLVVRETSGANLHRKLETTP